MGSGKAESRLRGQCCEKYYETRNGEFRHSLVMNPLVPAQGFDYDVAMPIREVCAMKARALLSIPRNLCKRLLHKFLIGPRLGEGAHIFQISRRKAFCAGEGLPQVGG